MNTYFSMSSSFTLWEWCEWKSLFLKGLVFGMIAAYLAAHVRYATKIYFKRFSIFPLIRRTTMSIKKLALAVVAAASMSAANAAIVTNGGFESGLAGWTVSTHQGAFGTGTQGPAAFEGSSYFWGFDNAGSGTLEQILATDVGGIYSVSLAFNTNGGRNGLSVSAGNLTDSLAITPGVWQTYTGTFTASSTSTALDFLFSTVPGSGTVWIDAVSVEQVGAAVPEPASMALLGLGLAGLAAARRRKAG